MAVSLAQLGIASSFVTCVPPNEVGYKVLSELLNIALIQVIPYLQETAWEFFI